jgi:ABC-type methionine transport system permease subunit
MVDGARRARRAERNVGARSTVLAATVRALDVVERKIGEALGQHDWGFELTARAGGDAEQLEVVGEQLLREAAGSFLPLALPCSLAPEGSPGLFLA